LQINSMWGRRILTSVARRGLWPTLKLAPGGAADAILRAAGFRKRLDDAGLDFDRRFGITTAGRIPLGELTVHSENVLFGKLYAPASVPLVKSLLDRLPISHPNFSFIDFGSGMGRVVLFASTYPFKEVRGVEFAEELHGIALENRDKTVNLAERHAPVRFECMDAVDYRIPDGNLVCFFFNPFEAPIMNKVIANLVESLRGTPRECYLIYVRPLARKVIDACGVWTPVEEDELHVIYRYDSPIAVGD
jgi:hypothetical protein